MCVPIASLSAHHLRIYLSIKKIAYKQYAPHAVESGAQ